MSEYWNMEHDALCGSLSALSKFVMQSSLIYTDNKEQSFAIAKPCS